MTRWCELPQNMDTHPSKWCINICIKSVSFPSPGQSQWSICSRMWRYFELHPTVVDSYMNRLLWMKYNRWPISSSDMPRIDKLCGAVHTPDIHSFTLHAFSITCYKHVWYLLSLRQGYTSLKYKILRNYCSITCTMVYTYCTLTWRCTPGYTRGT